MIPEGLLGPGYQSLALGTTEGRSPGPRHPAGVGLPRTGPTLEEAGRRAATNQGPRPQPPLVVVGLQAAAAAAAAVVVAASAAATAGMLRRRGA